MAELEPQLAAVAIFVEGLHRQCCHDFLRKQTFLAVVSVRPCRGADPSLMVVGEAD